MNDTTNNGTKATGDSATLDGVLWTTDDPHECEVPGPILTPDDAAEFMAGLQETIEQARSEGFNVYLALVERDDDRRWLGITCGLTDADALVTAEA